MASGGSHTVMPKRLAQALIEAGMHHFDSGGTVSTQVMPQNWQGGAQGQTPAPAASPSAGMTPTQGNPQLGQQNTISGPGGNPDILAAGQSGDVNMFTGAVGGRNGVVSQITPSTYLFDGLSSVTGGLKNLASQLTSQSQYQAQSPTIATQNFDPQIQAMQQRQNDVYGQQQNLAQALLNQSRGGGPNPAQAALAQATGQNVAQQGALMASQRGASANPALLARQAAMQGANIQQNSVGQAAALQAQQQLAAQQALQSQQNSMANQALQGESIQQGGQQAQNQSITQGQLGAQGINADTANKNAAAANGTFGSMLSGISSLGGLLYKGGEVKKMATGGMMMGPPEGGTSIEPERIELPVLQTAAPTADPVAAINTNYSQGAAGAPSLAPGPASPGVQVDWGGKSKGGGGGGGLGSMAGMLAALKSGGQVGGQAEVEGNSEKNDTVPALLSPGEIVLPRSVTQSPDMEKKAIEFLRHVKAKKSGYGGVLDARKEKMACGGRVK